MKNSRAWHLFRTRSEQFFTEGQRSGAKQKKIIKVVKPDKITEFIEYVLASKKINTTYKLIVTLQLSTGSRISEILNLKKSDIKIQDKNAIAIIEVLKKRAKEKKATPTLRGGAIHPNIVPLLEKHLASCQGKLFNLTRVAVWNKYQTMFGITPHSLRHSWITYLFEIKKWEIAKVVKNMQFAEWKTALKYHTTNIEKEAWDMFKE